MKIDFLREEFEAEYQDRLAEYEEELRGWKKEAKRRVTRNAGLFFVSYNGNSSSYNLVCLSC